jgi:hypothetical protein
MAPGVFTWRLEPLLRPWDLKGPAFKPSGVHVKFMLPLCCRWAADWGSSPTAYKSSLMFCAQNKKEKKLLPMMTIIMHPSFLLLQLDVVATYLLAKVYQNWTLLRLCLVEALIPKTTTSCKYPIQNLKACNAYLCKLILSCYSLFFSLQPIV